MNDIDFECTACGKCCHDLRLPLTLAEASDWLARGAKMELLCEAIPWPVDPAPGDELAEYRKVRSSPAMSGTLPVRISITLAGAFTGPCPNLGADMRCGIYEERPRVCRIYPAEINPFVTLATANKECPPEAWQGKPLQRQGVLVDDTTRRLIGESRRANQDEAVLRMQLCEALGLNRAALANEGFVMHTPDSGALLAAIQHVRANPRTVGSGAAQWTFVSNRATTLDALRSVEASSEPDRPETTGSFRYLGFFPAAA